MDLKVTFVVVGNNGGMVHYPANLINSVEDECNISVISITSGGEGLSSLINTENITRISIDPSRLPWNLPHLGQELTRLVSALRDTNPDIVHFPFYNNATMGLPPLFSLMGYQVIANIHDPVRKTGLRPRFWRERQIFDSKFMDRVLVHGESTANKAKSAGLPSDKIQKIPHGLYTHFADGEINDQGDEVLFFGTIRPDKGFKKIPKIVDCIQRELEVTVRVAGSLGADNWGKDILEELRTIPNVVVDEEYIPNDEVQSYFERAAVVVLPYREATTSGVLLTSYTFNTPVVTTDVGDLGQMVRKDSSGLVSEKNSSEDIANEVVKLLSDDRLRNEKVNNIKDNKSRYKWSSISKELFEIYESVEVA